MHVSNIGIAGKRLGHALHVADKFHILKGYQGPLSRIINIELHTLRTNKAADAAKRLWDMKPAVMAVDKKRRRERKKRGKPQLAIKFDELKLVYKDHPNVRRAVWSRYDLAMFFKQTNLADALLWWQRFHRRVAPWKDEKEVKRYLKHLAAHKSEIFNYFRAIEPTRRGIARGPTTNAIESNNRRIKDIADAANGTLNFEIFRMRVLYKNWKIGTEIVKCADPGCSTFLGPLIGPWGRPRHHVAAGGPSCPMHRI